jgi:hypothetical protein
MGHFASMLAKWSIFVSILVLLHARSTGTRSRIASPDYLVRWQSLRGPSSSGGQLVSGQGVGSEFRGDANQEAHYTDLKQIPLR